MRVWYESDNPNGFVTGKKFCVDEPCVTVMAAGMGGDSAHHWHIVRERERERDKSSPVMVMPTDDGKPLYYVPSMVEVASIPWNGLNVASTFSGCGGSCLGYRMAGFRVLWASKFAPHAQVSYEANSSIDCALDKRDVREVTVEDVLDACGLAEGELDVLDGSPPCQAFSTAGKRHKGWGRERRYEHGAFQKNEDLFAEYVRLLKGIRPKTFVAENVSGLVKGTCKGMFLEILASMKAAGYRVKAKVLDAQWLGVPQSRRRVIFVGVREDLGVEPVFPKPLPYRYSIKDAIPWIFDGSSIAVHDESGSWSNGDVTDRPSPTIRSSYAGMLYVESAPLLAPCLDSEYGKLSPGKQSGKYFNMVRPKASLPSPTIGACHGNRGTASVVHPVERRKFTIAELTRICSFPDDFVLTGSYAQQWSCLGNSVPPLMMRAVAEVLRDKVFRKIT